MTDNRRNQAKPGAWVKGQSGNPGGRPAIVKDIQELARQHTPQAIQALVEALKDTRTRVAAAIALLDRGYGRPTQALSIDHNFPAATAADAALAAIALASSGAPAVSEGDPQRPDGVVH